MTQKKQQHTKPIEAPKNAMQYQKKLYTHKKTLEEED